MDKKIIAIIAVIILLAAGVAAYIVATGNGEKAPKKALGSSTDVTVPIYGNANNDSYIDKSDIDQIKNLMTKGWDPVTYPYADADLDGFLTDKDIQLVQNIIDKKDCKINYMSHFGDVMSVKYPLSGKKIGVTYWQQSEMMAALGL